MPRRQHSTVRADRPLSILPRNVAEDADNARGSCLILPRFAGADKAKSFSRRMRARAMPTPFAKTVLQSMIPSDLAGGGTGLHLDHAPAFCLSMIFSENRYPLFRIMLGKQKGSGTPAGA
jgi:hypothetical protein